MSVYLYSRITVWQYFVIFVFLVFLDQISKVLAESAGWVSINTGVSFGWEVWGGIENQVFVGIILLVVLGILFFVLYRLGGLSLGSSVFLAGTFSNIIDRFLVGGVRDWMVLPGLNLQNNLADWFIFVGVVMILVVRD